MSIAMLLSLTVLPFVVGTWLVFTGERFKHSDAGLKIGLITTLMLLLFCGLLAPSEPVSPLDGSSGGISPYLSYSPAWLSVSLSALENSNGSALQLSIGLDRIGFCMICLTCLVGLSVLLVAESTVTHNRTSFTGWMLLAMAGLNLTFTGMDLISFYIGFELALLPLYPLISLWGNKEATNEAKRFMLFSLSGSIPLALGVLGLAQLYGSEAGWEVSLAELSRRASLAEMSEIHLSRETWIFAFLVLGFGIKMAMLPFHSWVPTTYGACHPTFTAFMAGVVVKLGIFGFLRLAIPLVPQACASYGPGIMGFLGAIAIVAGALAALSQTDLKRVFAYSSISHVGFITIGIFALNEEGICAGVIQMLGHGLTTAAIFLLLSCVMARTGSSDIGSANSGLASRYPKLAASMLFFLLAGAGMPGLCNFVGESLALTAMVSVNPLTSMLGALGIILGAWYTFRIAKDVLFDGTAASVPRDKTLAVVKSDISRREKSTFCLLGLGCLILGLYPQSVVGVIQADAQALSQMATSTKAQANSKASLEETLAHFSNDD